MRGFLGHTLLKEIDDKIRPKKHVPLQLDPLEGKVAAKVRIARSLVLR